MRRIALATLVRTLDRDARDRYESRMLHQHLTEAIASTFDPTPSARATPEHVETNATEQWEQVLELEPGPDRVLDVVLEARKG